MTGGQVAILAAALTGIAGVLAVAGWLYFQPADDGHVWAAAESEPVELPALAATIRTRRTGPMSGAPDWAVPVDDDTEAWLHQLVVEGRAERAHRLARPARVMACLVPPAVGAGIAALVLAARRAAPPPNVFGPAVVPDPPAAEPSSPQGGAAGPETPSYELDLNGHLINPPPLVSGSPHTPRRSTRPPTRGRLPLPPVDEAAHLQPIDWADSTGSFAAVCEADRG